MIKNIYDKTNKYYKHEYYCDCCFSQFIYDEILRHEKALAINIVDLCAKCYKKISNEEEEEEKKRKREYKKGEHQQWTLK